MPSGAAFSRRIPQPTSPTLYHLPSTIYHSSVQAFTAAIGLSVLGSFGGLLTASAFLLLGDGIRARVVPWAISYAVGTLLGVALLALLPEALEHLPPTAALGTLLAGVLTFFLLEKLVIWRHCHDGNGHECEAHTSSAAPKTGSVSHVLVFISSASVP